MFIKEKKIKLINNINKKLISTPLIKKISKKEEYKIELCKFIPSNIFAAFINDKTQNNVKRWKNY